MESLNALKFIQHEQNPADVKGKNDKKKLMEACQEFESVLWSYLLKNMRETVPETEFLPKGLEEEIFQSMLDQEIAKKLAQKGVGIATMLYRQLSNQTT